MTEEQLKLPGDARKGRPTNKQLDEREADLKRREEDLATRMADAPVITPVVEEDEAIGPNMRQSVNDRAQRETHGLHNPKAIRKDMQQGKSLDASLYNELYPDMQLMWINESKGDVQKWINEGAEPVPLATRAAKVYEGITDSNESKWVRAVGGENKQGHFWVYLLMIDPQIYYDIKIRPERERQRMIREAIVAGADQSHYGAGPKLPSYSAMLPTGEGQGFSESRETIAPENG